MRGFLLNLMAVVGILGATLLTPVQAAPDVDDALSSVKKMVGLIRYGKNDLALKSIGLPQATAYLMGSYHGQATLDQLGQIEGLLGEYLKVSAFPLARKYFEDIDLSYDKPVVKGDAVHIRASLLYGGSEQIKFTWVVVESDGEYVVTDFLDDRNQSSLKASRDKQIQKVLQRKGIPGLIKAMETAVEKAR